MHPFLRGTIVLLVGVGCARSTNAPTDEWRVQSAAGFRLLYQASDEAGASALVRAATTGRGTVESFSGEEIQGEYDVRVYPDRPSFEAYWRSIGFQPACWMIARATRAGVEMLSPRVWASEQCGHTAGEAEQIVTHETMHVLHARVNALPEINSVGQLKWFNEGIAVYASGQFDAGMRSQAAGVAARGVTGFQLSTLGLGSDLYSVGGSLAAFIDSTYGRSVLRRSLRATSTASLIAALGTTEADLLTRWSGRVR